MSILHTIFQCLRPICCILLWISWHGIQKVLILHLIPPSLSLVHINVSVLTVCKTKGRCLQIPKSYYLCIFTEIKLTLTSWKCWLQEKKYNFRSITDIAITETPINVFSHVQGLHLMQNLGLFMFYFQFYLSVFLVMQNKQHARLASCLTLSITMYFF